MTSSRIHNRFQAFLVHLVCSAAIAMLVLALVFLVWYPGLLASATGVDEIFLIVLGVDVCLGPLLTLVVFNLKKKELRHDLFIIFALQLSALLYGLYTVAIVRPVYVVFEVDRFQLVYANELNKEKLMNASSKEYKSLPYLGPKWISSKFPDDIQERNNLMFSTADGGDDLAKIPKYYIPYNDSREDIINHLSPINELKDYNSSNSGVFNELMDRYPVASSNVGFLPLKGYVMDLTVIVDKDTAEVIEIAKLQPWGN